MRRLSFEQLQSMTDQEVSDYWQSGVLPERDDVRHAIPAWSIGSMMLSRSTLESAERAWARKGNDNA